jgi:hypothetical protein
MNVFATEGLSIGDHIATEGLPGRECAAAWGPPIRDFIRRSRPSVGGVVLPPSVYLSRVVLLLGPTNQGSRLPLRAYLSGIVSSIRVYLAGVVLPLGAHLSGICTRRYVFTVHVIRSGAGSKGSLHASRYVHSGWLCGIVARLLGQSFCLCYLFVIFMGRCGTASLFHFTSRSVAFLPFVLPKKRVEGRERERERGYLLSCARRSPFVA